MSNFNDRAGQHRTIRSLRLVGDEHPTFRVGDMFILEIEEVQVAGQGGYVPWFAVYRRTSGTDATPRMSEMVNATSVAVVEFAR